MKSKVRGSEMLVAMKIAKVEKANSLRLLGSGASKSLGNKKIFKQSEECETITKKEMTWVAKDRNFSTSEVAAAK